MARDRQQRREVDRGPAASDVASDLRRGIRDGTLRSGTRLRLGQLVSVHGVSPAVARQAMAMLAEDSLASFDGYGGIVLSRPSLGDVVEDFEIRVALECRAIELAVDRLSREDMGQQDAWLAALRAALTPVRMRETGRLDPRFHEIINRAAGRPILLRMIQEARRRGHACQALLCASLDGVPYSEELEGEHEEIYEALRDRDRDRARNLLKAHLQRNQERNTAVLVGPSAAREQSPAERRLPLDAPPSEPAADRGSTGPGRTATTDAVRVAGELRERIRSAQLISGARLGQLDVARRHGVGVPIARAAIAILGRQGLARQDAKGGAVVYLPTRPEIDESLDIREALECLAIERVAPRITEAAIAKLAAILMTMQTVPLTDQQAEAGELNRSFHQAIYELANRPHLLRLIDEAQLAGRAYGALMADWTRDLDAERVHAEHVGILDALRSRDPNRAVSRLREHLEGTRRRLHDSWADR